MNRKIAFIHRSFPAGGAEKVTSDIARYFMDSGDQVYLFTQFLDEAKLIPQHEGLQFITLANTAPRKYDSRENGIFIVEKIQELGIDIFVFPVEIAKMMRYVRSNSSAKIVFTLHNTPLWEVPARTNNRRNKMLYKGNWQTKLEWYFFRAPIYKYFNYYKKRYRKLYKFAYANCDVFTVLVDQYKHEVIKLLKLDPHNNNVQTIRNFLIPLNPPVVEKKKRLLYLGRLNYADKRVDRLVDIWGSVYKKFPDWEFWIVGEGDEEQSLRRMVEAKKLERVTFHKYTNNPSEYYAEAAIIGMTSEFEGWPLVLAEAQESGVVPIAYDSAGGIVDQIGTDGKYGVLVPAYNKTAYVKRLSALMKNEELLKQMSINVREKAKTYDMEKSCMEWLALFDRLMS